MSLINFSLPTKQVDEALLGTAEYIEGVTAHLEKYNQTLDTAHLNKVYSFIRKTNGQRQAGHRISGWALKSHGACWLASRPNNGITVYVPEAMRVSFEYYSGNPRYPIAHPEQADSAVAFSACEDMWAGEYGRRRIMYLQLFKAAALQQIGGKHPRPIGGLT